ncbi:UxaA family hydrolase [Escherichia coli]
MPNVDGVVGLNHLYGCGVAINAPAAVVPIRTIHNISLNPDFGGEVMVIGLGCEKLQPERLLVGTDDVEAIPVESAALSVCRMKSVSVLSPWSRNICRSLNAVYSN